MALSALLQFTQGATVGGQGIALVVTSGNVVVISNSDNSSVQSYRLELCYAPPGSVHNITPGVTPPIVLAEGNGVPSYSFLPENGVYGCYRFRLTTWSGGSFTGNSDVDIRCIATRFPNDLICPPLQKFPDPLPLPGSGLAGAKPGELNFGGQPYGWTGDANPDHPLLWQALKAIGSGGGGGSVFVTNPILGDGTSGDPLSLRVGDGLYIYAMGLTGEGRTGMSIGSLAVAAGDASINVTSNGVSVVPGDNTLTTTGAGLVVNQITPTNFAPVPDPTPYSSLVLLADAGGADWGVLGMGVTYPLTCSSTPIDLTNSPNIAIDYASTLGPGSPGVISLQGDLGGTGQSPTVQALQGVSVPPPGDAVAGYVMFCSSPTSLDYGQIQPGVAIAPAYQDSILMCLSGQPAWYPPEALSHSNLGNLTTSDDHPQYLRTDGTRALIGTWNIGGTSFTITGVPTPTNSTDVANKAYVDLLAQGIEAWLEVDCLADYPVGTYTGETVIDSFTTNNSRVNLTSENNPVNNGIWVTGTPWTRPADFPNGGHAAAHFVFVKSGATWKGTGWICTSTSGSDVIGTSPLYWSQFSAAGVITAGNGLTQYGTQISVMPRAGGLLMADEFGVGITTGTSNAVIASDGYSLTWNTMPRLYGLYLDLDVSGTAANSGLLRLANTGTISSHMAGTGTGDVAMMWLDASNNTVVNAAAGYNLNLQYNNTTIAQVNSVGMTLNGWLTCTVSGQSIQANASGGSGVDLGLWTNSDPTYSMPTGNIYIETGFSNSGSTGSLYIDTGNSNGSDTGSMNFQVGSSNGGSSGSVSFAIEGGSVSCGGFSFTTSAFGTGTGGGFYLSTGGSSSTTTTQPTGGFYFISGPGTGANNSGGFAVVTGTVSGTGVAGSITFDPGGAFGLHITSSEVQSYKPLTFSNFLSDVVNIRSQIGATGNGALYLGSAAPLTSAAAGNYSLKGDGSNTTLNAPTGGSLQFAINDTAFLTLNGAFTQYAILRAVSSSSLALTTLTLNVSTPLSITNSGNLGTSPSLSIALASNSTSGIVPSALGAGTGYVLTWNGTNVAWASPPAPSGTAGGDLAGTYPNPTINQITGASGALSVLASTWTKAHNGSTWTLQTIASATTDGITIQTGNSTVADNGIAIQCGTNSAAAGGAISITGGATSGTGNSVGGAVSIYGGLGNPSVSGSTGGAVNIYGGAGQSYGGAVTISSGASNYNWAGALTLQTGNGVYGVGPLTIQTGNSTTSGTGGNIVIQTGTGPSGHASGYISLATGNNGANSAAVTIAPGGTTVASFTTTGLTITGTLSATTFGSGAATSGYVLTANGTGGSSWSAVSIAVGTANSLYRSDGTENSWSTTPTLAGTITITGGTGAAGGNGITTSGASGSNGLTINTASTSYAGSMIIYTGDSSGSSSYGASITMYTGIGVLGTGSLAFSTGTCSSGGAGSITFTTGNGYTYSGSISLTTGSTSQTSATGGGISLSTGASTGTGTTGSGNVSISTGANSYTTGGFSVLTGNSNKTSATTGSVTLETGNATATGGVSGSIYLWTGSSLLAANTGSIYFYVGGNLKGTFSTTGLSVTGAVGASTAITAGTYLALGTTPAGAGTIRMPNAGSIQYYTTGAFNANLISSDSGDNINIGSTSYTPAIALNVKSGSLTANYIETVFGSTVTSFLTSAYANFYAGAASNSSGNIILQNWHGLTAAAAIYMNMAPASATNTNFTLAADSANVYLNGISGIELLVNNTQYMYCGASMNTFYYPLNLSNGVPSGNPSGGGYLYADGGAGKWRSPSGTTTTFGPAEPHCPRCKRDFAHEWENTKTREKLSVCMPCLMDALEAVGVSPEDYSIENTLKKAA